MARVIIESCEQCSHSRNEEVVYNGYTIRRLFCIKGEMTITDGWSFGLDECPLDNK